MNSARITTLWTLSLLALWFAPSIARADIVTFEDRGAEIGPNAAFFGPSPGYFTSGGATFGHYYANDPMYGAYWGGITYSTMTDSTTPGFGNQFSAFAGSGNDGSSTYGIVSGYNSFLGTPAVAADLLGLPTLGLPTLTLPSGAILQSASVTNTTYTALVIANGDSYSNEFVDGDYFVLTIYGVDAANNLLGNTVEVILADFRGQEFILNTWLDVDLSSLAGAESLYFNLSSTDNDVTYGMNTPGYFAIDDITFAAVPEPGTWAMGLCVVAMTGLWIRRRKTRQQAA